MLVLGNFNACCKKVGILIFLYQEFVFEVAASKADPLQTGNTYLMYKNLFK